MNRNEQAELHQRIADIEEDTEARMHSVADLTSKSDHLHELASRISARARAHQRRAAELRRGDS